MKYLLLGITVMSFCWADHRLTPETDNFFGARLHKTMPVNSGANATLSLRIHRIECLTKTNADPAQGADKIYLAGFTIDANAAVTQIKPFPVGEFNTGVNKAYDPPQPTYNFYLPGGLDKTRNFTVGIMLFEEQKARVSETMQEMYVFVNREILKKKLIYRADENTPLSPLLPPQGPVSTSKLWELARAEVYYGINKKIDEGPIHDKLFPLHDVTITLNNNDHNWAGNKTSPVSMIAFKGYCGEYRIYYDWTIK